VTLNDRYGVESDNRRRARQVAAAAVALVLIGWLGWAAWEHSRSGVSGRVVGFDVVSPHEVEVSVSVSRHDGQAVSCEVVAQADDHATVGEGTVTVRGGTAEHVTVTKTIRTERLATTASISGCQALR
jgi:hypothetical protein